MDEQQIQLIVNQLVNQLTKEKKSCKAQKTWTAIENDEKSSGDSFYKISEKSSGDSFYKIAEKSSDTDFRDTVTEDLTDIDIRKWYLVDQPLKPEIFKEMKAKTPARIGVGRAGARYKTKTMLRFAADHAAAQDTVFSDVSEDFVKEHHMIPVKTLCKDKDEYLTRPDLGRRFSDEEKAVIEKVCKKNSDCLIVVGDGLSSAAIEANVGDMLPALKQGLETHGIHTGDVLFIKYARVGAMDDIGEITDAKVICMLVGERPGLVTAESMSAYITYMPKHGIAESKRTVISNIHRGGTNPSEAGAHAAELIVKMLEKKASGIDLKLLG
ncbi:MAG: ethanolamine ammonia-lyase subunit EutC [Clostridiales bacterium]|nr:ethanolamine ammonia-lyase subunit EutC [Clostridiales bacterium]MDY3746715.1 ethanolamine ammonia-lyase subunit EutC [Lachnospiraceae bacterium]